MLLPALIAAVLLSSSSPFCSGFEAGYVAGYCGGSATCLEPLVPLCPLPPLGQDSFAGGYRIGMLRGMAAAR